MSDQNNNGEEIFEDFDDLDLNDGDFNEDFQAGSGTLGGLMKSPIAKIGVVAGGVIAILGGVVLFGGGGGEVPTSRLSAPADVSEPPGTQAVSEAYRQALEEKNLQKHDEAIRDGGSAIPEPVAPPVGRVKLTQDNQEEEDPLARWRRIQEERQKLKAEQQQKAAEEVMAAVPVQQQPEADNEVVTAWAEAMSQQMNSILGGREGPSVRHMTVTSVDRVTNVAGKDVLVTEEGDGLRINKDGDIVQDVQVVNVILPAGTIEFGRLITEANTDFPSPILGEIVSGPLRGTRILGRFQTAQRSLVLRFTTAVVDGISYGIDALALEPESARAGIVTEYDSRFFRRVILPGAAAFVQGLGEGIADAGKTDVSVNGQSVTSSEKDLGAREELFNAIKESADEIGDFLEEEADATPPLIRVAPGTPMALLFLTPVTDQ